MVTGDLAALYLFCWAVLLLGRFSGIGNLGFILYKMVLRVQISGVVMSLWQLRIALLWRQVERVEVVAVRCSGYAVQVIALDGGVQALLPVAGVRLWPSLPALKVRLRCCGVRRMVLVQRHSHDEIIGRPALQVADSGLLMPL
ncbi:DUF6482 family protein [Pseudomonas sp. SA3-5]|uniref:DUF6482 family protein n=1 Tax=Pseudomonas aestuarii TaxID=3018340 RepID=A0ABT4XB02_9PSED|nr:DUF6482 family protein [Pseudomonas aestuarii]MDA7085463.1 DUF6482 family protein [Pseudomonas aestuarii]